MFDLSGRTALVTGSTSGIGEATALVLAGAGAHVVVSGRSCSSSPVHGRRNTAPGA